MKKPQKFISVTLLSLGVFFTGCTEEEFEFGDLNAPKIDAVNIDVPQEGDADYGSGDVTYNLNGEGIIKYIIYPGDGSSKTFNYDGNQGAVINYAAPGINTYGYTIVAIGVGGTTSTTTGDVEVFTDLDETTKAIFEILSGSIDGDSSKTWILDAGDEPGFYGVGPGGPNVPVNEGDLVYWWAPTDADFNEDCILNDQLTFNFNASSFTLSLSTDAMGDTWYHDDYTPGIPGGSDTAECIDNAPPAASAAIVSVTSDLLPEFTTSRAIELGGDGFMGLYIGTAPRTYEILSIDCNTVALRIFFFDDDEDRENAWYLRFRSLEDATGCGVEIPTS